MLLDRLLDRCEVRRNRKRSSSWKLLTMRKAIRGVHEAFQLLRLMDEWDITYWFQIINPWRCFALWVSKVTTTLAAYVQCGEPFYHPGRPNLPIVLCVQLYNFPILNPSHVHEYSGYFESFSSFSPTRDHAAHVNREIGPTTAQHNLLNLTPPSSNKH